MSPRLSSLLANLALLGGIPFGLGVAYLGFLRGVFPYRAVPFVAVGVFLVIIVALFVVLPPLRRLEGAE